MRPSVLFATAFDVEADQLPHLCLTILLLDLSECRRPRVWVDIAFVRLDRLRPLDLVEPGKECGVFEVVNRNVVGVHRVMVGLVQGRQDGCGRLAITSASITTSASRRARLTTGRNLGLRGELGLASMSYSPARVRAPRCTHPLWSASAHHA